MKRNAPLNMIMQRGGVIFLLMILLSCNSGPDSHTVTFSLDGGYFPEGYETTITITEGSTLEGIPDPKKDSTYNYRYTFAGWYTDESFTDEYEYDTTLPVTSDLTLYAKWNRYSISHTKIYTVSFQSNGGTEISSQSVVNGSMAEEPAEPEMKGYFFDGWYSEEDTSMPYDFDTPVTSSITLYAKWTKAWTVTFSLGLPTDINVKATIATETIYVKDGCTITFPEITIGDNPLLNIKFKDTSTGNEFNSDSPISSNLALTAFIDDYAIADDTYYVTTENGLNAWAEAVKNSTNLDCMLCDDITLSKVPDEKSNWTPVSSYTGIFDGNDKTITGLTISQSSESNVGLFASIKNEGTVKNLTLDNVDITAGSNVGAVAGENRGTIENCSVSGSVTGSSVNGCVGGIAGWNYRGTITDCHSSVTVEGMCYVGGIAGQNDAMLGNASITACYSTGSVTATKNNTTGYSYAGGVVGLNSNGAVLTACYATGNIKGDGEFVGGVVGDNVFTTITACYHATGSVTGELGSTGGVAGRNYNSSIVFACYWNGPVTGDTGIGNDMTNAGEAHEVSGKTTWTEAMGHMNSVLTGVGTGWLYATGSGDVPLMLKKQ